MLKAQTNKVRLARMKGELIERSQAMAQVFKLARAERDAWLNWPTWIFSSKASAEPGRWASRRTLYLRQIVGALSQPYRRSKLFHFSGSSILHSCHHESRACSELPVGAGPAVDPV